MKAKLWWISGAIILGLDVALLPWYCPQYYALYPCPVIPMLPLFPLSGWKPIHYLYFLLGPILFFASSPSLLLGRARISKKDVWVLVTFAALELLYFVASWRDGFMYYPGPFGTKLTIVIGLLWLSALFVLMRIARKRQTHGWIFAYHFVFILWLVTYAFPWFGEMP